MSDTPRTDAAKLPDGEYRGPLVWCDFARQLERELNEVKEQLSDWKHKFEVVGKPIPVDSYHHWTGEICEARKDRDKWKAMAQELAIKAHHRTWCAPNQGCSCGLAETLSRFNELNKP